MDKSGKIRIIVWSVLAVICLSLGAIGYYKVYSTNKISSADEQVLKRLIELFNENDDFNNLRKVGIDVNAKLKNKKIVVDYKSESENKTYDFIFDKDSNYLDFKSLKSDAMSIVMVKNMLDAISIYHGNKKNAGIEIFNSIIDLNEYTIIYGMTYTEENDYIVVKININIPLKEMANNIDKNKNVDDNTIIIDDQIQIITNDSYFTLEDLTSYKESIMNGEFNQDKNNLIMKTTNINNIIYISIFENEKLSDNAYKSMMSILKLLLDETTYNSFENNYKNFDTGNININGITVEKTDVTPNDYESDIVNENGELVRISLSSSLVIN